ncbi:GNAT family N-acetyltransferase [Flindersiella endophytica]
MDTPDPRDLWLMQLRLECKQLDAGGWLVRCPGDDPDAIPDCALTRFHSYYELTFSRTAGAGLREQIRCVDPRAFFDGSDVADDFAATHGLRLQRFSTYYFAQPPPTATECAGQAEVVRRGPESFAAVVSGQAVAWATSARSNDECAELWVHTDPAQLRRGYARRVSQAWAAAVTGGGRVAFYSHLAANDPSRQLARSLGVTQLFDVAALTAIKP